MTLVRARGVSKTVEGADVVHVLSDVSVQLEGGELALLVGPSGSGKTTLLSILAGLLRPTTGEVHLCGCDLSSASERLATATRRQHVGFMFQTPNLFPALTALENVVEVLVLRGMSRPAAVSRAEEALTGVRLAHRLHHRPSELSGGEKQRVAIARAVAGDPSVILGDEITAALDTKTALDVMSVLREYLTETRTMLIVTHDRRLESFADRVIELRDGRVVTDSNPRGEAP